MPRIEPLETVPDNPMGQLNMFRTLGKHPKIFDELFVNLVQGVIARVSPQMNIFAIGFPITISVGLVGVLFTLPMMEVPFTMALERMLANFQ